MHESAERRRKPGLADTDWLILKRMETAIRDMAEKWIAPGDAVLDLGCGSQPYRPLFESRQARYLGADFGETADVKIESSGRVNAQDDCADCVVSFQVLEHVRDLDMYLSEAHRLVRSDGRVLLSTHGTWLYHPHPEDHRRWTREGLHTDLEMRGFEVEECIGLVGPLAWTTMIRLTSYAFVLRKIPFFGRPLSGVLASIMNSRAWFEDRLTPGWVRENNACVYLTRLKPKAVA